ncbi:hypothetical protein [Streptosporangium minutum]|uniref:DUF732 domain-containing protein n=1 Tax=Streptosporangium minutum TaxID=569862 RepID=A0A243RVY3_9ACTN|nr:hypothetical protein [Streptosporangium minutum]OUC99325.1 hypothetical protein CA984_03710 [Streptosporangium minutum]
MHPPQQPQQGPYGQPTQQYTQPGPPPGWQQPPPPPKKGGKGAAIAIVIGLIVVLAALGGLLKLVDGGGEVKVTGGDEQAVATPAAVSKIPKPDAQQTEDLLYGLRQIDRELDRARSIDRARNSCSDLLNGEDRNDVIKRTQLRFDGVADIDTADARAIVKLIEDGGWCR